MSATSAPLTDSRIMLRRNLKHILRNPVTIFNGALMPVVLMLLLVYVFGNAFNVGEHYVEYATPGLILLAITYGLSGTAVSVNSDMTKGIINRFKVMNVSRGAVLNGHVVATMLGSSIAVAVIIGMAFALGFRSPATPSNGLPRSVSSRRQLSRPPGSRSRWGWLRKLRNPRASPSCR